jgi:lipopolysaccharide/colanic/teichoic acid biosynthesis glycosyltransferase
MAEQSRSFEREAGHYETFVKPVMDVVGGLVATVLSAPLVVVIAIAILATMGRPVLYRQQRVGKGGRVFTVFKFRTMDHDRRERQQQYSGDDRRVNHKTHHDPRHTRLGRVLRKWSLDEIPQFWNVLAGDMSLVGPRPELVEIVARYEPWQHRRHLVKPGITGVWQISERGDTPMHEATDIDLEYVESMSFRGDLKILLKTVPALLSRSGH